MKIYKATKYPIKLLKLKLIKTKIYKKNNQNYTKIEDIISKLKKALNLIYHYQSNGKHILFVGSPVNLKFNRLLESLNHTFIPESVWMNGILTNKSSCFKFLSKHKEAIDSQISTILFKTNKKSDLIVILNFSSNENAVKEGYLTKIPVISLNLNLDTGYGYNVPGNFKFTNKKIRDNFFYSLLSATLKKALMEKQNKKKPRINRVKIKNK